jgi:hypothetical protein
MSRGYFLDLSVERRVELVTRLVRERAGWAPLTCVNVPKGPGKEGTRPICYPTTLDAVRQMILGDRLGAYAETVLSPQAVGYRHGVAMTRTVRGAIAKARQERLYVVAVADVRGFFDTIAWKHLRKVIRGLPADDAIKTMLQAGVEADVLDRRSREPVDRMAGTPRLRTIH